MVNNYDFRGESNAETTYCVKRDLEQFDLIEDPDLTVKFARKS